MGLTCTKFLASQPRSLAYLRKEHKALAPHTRRSHPEETVVRLVHQVDMPGTLDREWVFGSGRSAGLTWNLRYRIYVGYLSSSRSLALRSTFPGNIRCCIEWEDRRTRVLHRWRFCRTYAFPSAFGEIQYKTYLISVSRLHEMSYQKYQRRMTTIVLRLPPSHRRFQTSSSTSVSL